MMKHGHRASVELHNQLSAAVAAKQKIFRSVENTRAKQLADSIEECLSNHILELEGLVLSEYGSRIDGKFESQVKSCGANTKGGGGFQAGNTCGRSRKPKLEEINKYSRKFASEDNPITVQVTHGTAREFEQFDFDYAGSGSGVGAGTSDGFFFAEDDSHSEYWARHAADSSGFAAKVLDVELEINSYLEFDVGEFVNSDHPQAGNPIDFAVELARDEYDAIRFVNGQDIPDSDPMDWWFVFDPTRASIKNTRELTDE
jgi:hypothetical protein